MDNSKRTKRQTVQWTIVNGQKDRQYNGQQLTDKKADNTMDTSKRTKGQTIQWTLVSGRKDRQYNGHQ